MAQNDCKIEISFLLRVWLCFQSYLPQRIVQQYPVLYNASLKRVELVCGLLRTSVMQNDPPLQTRV